MEHTYKIDGMTCQGCVASVTEKLIKVDEVEGVNVSLEKGEAQISMNKPIQLDKFKSVLTDKYTISEMDKILNKDIIDEKSYGQQGDYSLPSEKSKIQQLKPLLLIFLYLFSAAILINYKEWNTAKAMLDFMGLFYIVFSFFKLLDLKGFPDSFRMYDPLARIFPAYGWIYPFLELALGLMFLMRFQITIALTATIIILGITTIGVTKTLLDKKSIRCACLGTALKLPMTEATFIENAIMLVMAFTMLIMPI